jgi:hypothetical protein
MKSPRLFKSPILAVLVLAGLSVCRADIVYQDTFQRVGPLTNSAPTVDNTGNGVTWAGNAKYSTDGTNCIIPSDWTWSWPTIGLPIDMGYFWDTTLSCDVKLDNASTSDWVGISYGPVGDYWNQALYLTLAGNGMVNAYIGPPWGVAMQLVTNAPAGIPGDWNNIAITYSNYAATADIIVNGFYVAQGVSIPLSGASGVNLIQYNQGGARIANFQVTTPSSTATPPSMDTQPVGKQVFAGDPVTLTARASGTLPLAYQWRKNASEISGATSVNFTIPATAPTDSGSYTLVVTNAGGAVTSAVAKVTVYLESDVTLAATDFETYVPGSYGYTYTYSSTNVPLPNYWTNLPAGGTSGSIAGAAVLDGTGFSGVQVDFAGLAGAVFMPASVSTTNLYCYKYSFDARVENLLPDTVSNTVCRLTLSFKAYDGTNYSTPLAGSRSITLSSNFQHFTFTLDTSDYGGASALTQLANNLKWVNAFQLEITADGIARDFVNGPGDTVVLDNIQVVQRTSPPLSVTQNLSGQPVVEWADTAVTLQSATNVVGPYTDVLGATSPYTVPAGHTMQFFRTRW